MEYQKCAKIQEEENLEKEISEILITKLGEFSSINEVAKTLSISRGSVYRAIESGKILALHLGTRIIICTRSLVDAMEIEK